MVDEESGTPPAPEGGEWVCSLCGAHEQVEEVCSSEIILGACESCVRRQPDPLLWAIERVLNGMSSLEEGESREVARIMRDIIVEMCE